MTRPGKIDIDDFLDRPWTWSHDQDAIGELDRLFNVVGDKENGFLFALPDAYQIGAHFQASEKVERAERFIHVNDVGIRRERARDLHTLAHPAGKLVRIGVFKSGQTHHVDVARDDLVPFYWSAFLQAKANVLTHV